MPQLVPPEGMEWVPTKVYINEREVNDWQLRPIHGEILEERPEGPVDEQVQRQMPRVSNADANVDWQREPR